MPLSINGWSVQLPTSSRLATGTVYGTTARLRTREELLPLFLSIAYDYHREVARLRPAECGGYAYRQANAADAWSDHASGTAIDLNWNHEGAMGPTGGMATMTDAQIAACARIKQRYEVVIWGGDKARGGDYSQPRYWDPMHYAIRRGVTLADARAVIYKLNIQADGRRHPVFPGTTLRLGSTGWAVRDLRRHLGLPEGNLYDEKVRDAVKEFKRRRPLLFPVPSGVCGSFAWKRITGHR